MRDKMSTLQWETMLFCLTKEYMKNEREFSLLLILIINLIYAGDKTRRHG